MRKLSYIFLGALIGVALTIGGGAFAASTGLVGKKIVSEVPIIFNGQQIADHGSVADGTTLLPVRALAALLGLKTDYKDGTVYITGQAQTGGDSGVSETVPPDGGSQTPQLTAEQIQKEIKDIDDSIQSLNDAIISLQKVIDDGQVDGDLKNFDLKAIESYKSKIDTLTKQKADLEAQLQALQSSNQ